MQEITPAHQPATAGAGLLSKCPSGSALRRVWLITVGEPLPLDGRPVRLFRTGILAHLLAERGVEVVWWTSTVDHFTKAYFVEGDRTVPLTERLTLQFLHGRLYHRNVSLSRLRNHREIARAFSRLAPQQERPDLVLCSLPTIELSAAAVEYGRAAGVPVLLDVRDLWPEEMVAKLPKPLRALGPALFRPMFREVREALRGATGIVAISRAHLHWGLAHAARAAGPGDAVFAHGYPRPAAVPDAGGSGVESGLRRAGVDPAKRVFWFVGTFIASIDLGTVIEAARRLAGRDDIQFVLSGSGERDAEWRGQARGLDNVVFTGWVDRPAIAWLSRIAFAGIAAYRPDSLIMNLTNKMFEYMSAGLPVLSSVPGEPAEVLAANDCGLFYAPGNAGSLAAAVTRLADNPDLHARQSANARTLFDRDYAADVVYPRMIAFLEDVARRGR